MHWEIQDSKKSTFWYSTSDIKKLDLENLQQEAFFAVRKEFLDGKDCLSLLKHYKNIWTARIQSVFSLPQIENNSEIPCIKIVSIYRDFFCFPREIIRDINKGWISLFLRDQVQRELWYSSLNEAFFKSLQDEVNSWFFSIWEDLYSLSLLAPSFSNAKRISSALIYKEWKKRQKFCFLSIFRFKWHVYRFLHRSGLWRKEVRKSRIVFKPRHDLLYLRCNIQKKSKILKKVLTSKIILMTGHVPWKRYRITFFLAALIFSGLTLNLYRHSEIPSQPPSQELAQTFMSENQKEIREAGYLFYNSISKIERIRQYDYHPDKLHGIFWKEKEYNKRLVLTFDDGPNMSMMEWGGGQASVTAAILDTLSSRGLTGVFFINGKNLESGSAEEEQDLRNLLNRMIMEGNMIGNHSYHHYNLAHGIFSDGSQDYQDIKEEFDKTQTALDRVLGYHYPLILIRPPYAEPGRTDVLDHVLKDNGQYLISLQFDSYDYAYTKEGYWQADKLLTHVKELIIPAQGGVLLMHDHESSVPLLNAILDDQDIRSCTEIVDLSEILFDKYQKHLSK